MPEWIIPAVGVAFSPLPILAMLLVLGGSRSAGVALLGLLIGMFFALDGVRGL